MKRRIICAILVFVLLFSVIVLTGMKRLEAGNTAVLYVDPSTSLVTVNEVFSINVSVANVTDFWGVEFKLSYNSSLLNATSVVPGPIFTSQAPNYFAAQLNVSVPGIVWFMCVLTPPATPFNGSGVVATITFSAEAVGTTGLHLYDTIVIDDTTPVPNPIEHTTQDGSVTVAEPIKIGVVGPMDFISGQGMWEGAVLAAEKINATGGILGHPVELHQGMEYTFPDDPAESAAEVERLITDVEVDFLLGVTMSSPTGFAMREVAMDYQKIFFIAGGAAFNELVDCGNGYDPDGPLGPSPPGSCLPYTGGCVRCNYTRYKYLFRVLPVNGTTIFLSLAGFYRFVLEQKLLPIYGELLWEGAPNPQVKVAVITENHTWADGFYLYLTNPAIYPHPNVLGPYANVTYSSRVRWNATDFTEELTAIRNSGARLIIHMFSRMDGVNFIEQLRDMNIEAVPVGINIASQTGEMWNWTSGKCEYETFLVPSGTRTPITNLSIPFWDAYVARWGHDPIYTAWGAYETIIALDEMFEANFASMPDLSNQTAYDNLIPLIEKTDRIGTRGRFKYTGPNPNLNSTNYPFYSVNPNFTGTLHDVSSLSLGPTWIDNYTRVFIIQWQAGKKEVIWPADQSYSEEFALPPWMETIEIGVIRPMDFIQGQGIWEGATLAAEEINATGGINVSGVLRPIELHSGMESLSTDWTSDPAASAAEVERLITDVEVDFLIGGFNTENIFAMREVAMDYQKIFIISGAAGGSINGVHHDMVDCGNQHDPDGPLGPTPPGPCNACVRCNYARYKYLFRAAPVNGSRIAGSIWTFHRFVLENKLLPIYGEMLWEGAPNPQVKVAVITENFTLMDSYHLYSTDPAIYPSVLGPYANVTYVARPSINETDFTAYLTAIRDSGARLIIHTFVSEAGLTFIKQWRDMEIEAVPVGINVVSQTGEMWNWTDGKCEYETFLATTGSRTPLTNLSIPFWNEHLARWGHDPIYTAWGAYEAIYTLKEAIERAGTTDSDAVVAELEQTDRMVTTGKFKFTEYHNVFCNEIGPTWTQGYSRPLIVQWQAGELEVIWPADQSYSKNFKLPPTRVSVVPSTDVAVAGQSFTVNITVSFAVDLYLWAFSISWNPATLDLVDVTEGDFLMRGGGTTGVLIKEINQTGGYMREAACSLLGSVPGVNGSGTLATLTFKATTVGSSPLDIYFCDLLNSTGESISLNTTDSSVDIDAPDLSISNVSLPYPDQSLYVNTTVSVNVTIQNTGNVSATAFNVSLTAYWDEGEIVDYFEKLTVESLEPNTTRTLQFTFTLHYTGNYTLTFNVDCDNEVIELNETNNELNLTIKVKMQGDIDGDNEVTYLDLFDLSRAYWSTPEDANWNPYADINNDGTVDYNDLFLLAQNYSLP